MHIDVCLYICVVCVCLRSRVRARASVRMRACARVRACACVCDPFDSSVTPTPSSGIPFAAKYELITIVMPSAAVDEVRFNRVNPTYLSLYTHTHTYI